jgi:hypothetical protein
LAKRLRVPAITYQTHFRQGSHTLNLQNLISPQT